MTTLNQQSVPYHSLQSKRPRDRTGGHSERRREAMLYYLELRYRNTPGDKMRYTWVNDNENWYGFWHFEIIATLAYMLQHQSWIPDGVNTALLHQRLTETKIWLENNVR